MKNLFKSKKGFTLVEIVIVIAIIGLLMIILIPSAINAFKNNRLQGAKIKAQRVAQSIEAGIGSGKIPLTQANADSIGATGTTLLINISSSAPQPVSDVIGLSNIYNLPSNNDDLVDPLSVGVASDDANYFRIYWVGTAGTAPEGKAFIVNSENAQENDANEMVIYSNTGDDLKNPTYK